MILTFLYALAVAAVLGLPADYTWRRARQLAPLAGLASAAAIIAAIYLAARIGLLHRARRRRRAGLRAHRERHQRRRARQPPLGTGPPPVLRHLTVPHPVTRPWRTP